MNKSPTTQNDSWFARLIAWAEEFQIPEKDLPRSRDTLLSLQELDLNHDFDSPVPKITWLPPEIGQLQQLQQLQLDSNRLTTLPPQIGQLQQWWCPKMYADKRQANKKQRRHGIFEVWKLKIPFAVPVVVDRI